MDKKFDEDVELIRNWHLMWSKFYFYKKPEQKLKTQDLLKKMGHKTLIVELQDKISVIPPSLEKYNLSIGTKKMSLNYTPNFEFDWNLNWVIFLVYVQSKSFFQTSLYPHQT